LRNKLSNRFSEFPENNSGIRQWDTSTGSVSNSSAISVFFAGDYFSSGISGSYKLSHDGLFILQKVHHNKRTKRIKENSKMASPILEADNQKQNITNLVYFIAFLIGDL